MNTLQNAIQSCQNYFKSQNRTIDSLSGVFSALHSLNSSDLDLPRIMAEMSGERSWDTQDLFENETFSMKLFLIPGGQKLPLHDHPGMTVFFKCLWGHMKIRSFDWAEEYPFSGLARVRLDTRLDGSSPTLLILPHFQNLHEIVAQDHCAFIDIFSPYYSESKPCTYYQDKERVQAPSGEVLTRLEALSV